MELIKYCGVKFAQAKNLSLNPVNPKRDVHTIECSLTYKARQEKVTLNQNNREFLRYSVICFDCELILA